MTAVTVVRLGYEGAGLLVLENAHRGPSGELWWVTAIVEHDGITASTRVSAHYATCFDDLIAFLAALADGWQGWHGAKTWTSLEQELSISATHDGIAHVRLAVTIQGPGQPFRWSLRAQIDTDPGAQMERAADDARALLARLA
jgi:hypothetical protein